jgi:hypothetical protein
MFSRIQSDPGVNEPVPNTVTIEIPPSLTAALAMEKGEDSLPRWALETLVIEAVREHVISRGFGGELLGLNFGQREELVARQSITYDLSSEELVQEEGDRDRMFGRE